MQFEFATSTRILFGPGVVQNTGELAAAMGNRALVVHGVNNNSLTILLSNLDRHGIYAELHPIKGEPTVADVQAGVKLAKALGCNLVISIGGGSALDTGKAIAGMMTNPGDIYDYLEIVGKGKSLSAPATAFIAIPTTAGTGSEVTRNAVLSVEVQDRRPGEHIKVSLRSSYLLPRLALVDPELTLDLPPKLTASTGMDALTQLIEPYLSNKANPLTDGLCREGISRAARSIQAAYLHGDDLPARTELSIASLFGGLALANAKLGAVHGFAAPLGGMFPAPHGAVCARLLPLVMESNFNALSQRQPNNPVLMKFDEVAKLLTGDPAAAARDGIDWLHQLCQELNIPGLSHYGVSTIDFPAIVEKAARASSMQGNPILLTELELNDILEKAL